MAEILTKLENWIALTDLVAVELVISLVEVMVCAMVAQMMVVEQQMLEDL